MSSTNQAPRLSVLAERRQEFVAVVASMRIIVTEFPLGIRLKNRWVHAAQHLAVREAGSYD